MSSAKTPACLVAVMMLVGMARAGEQSPDVSKEAMSLLLRGPGLALGDKFDLQRGSAPSAFPRDLLPPDVEISVAGVGDRGTVVVGMSRAFTEADRLAENARIVKAGWVQMSTPFRGLVPTASAAPFLFCRGAQFATVAGVPRVDGGSFIRVSLAMEPGRTCAAGSIVEDMNDVNIPALYPPAGVRSFDSTRTPGRDVSHYGARLTVSHTVKALGAHYVDQLRASGWKSEGRPLETKDRLYVARLTSKSGSGADVTAIVTVTSLDAGYVDIQLRVLRNRPSDPARFNPLPPR